MTEADRADRRRWLPRPWRARGLRLLVYALPLAGSLGFVRLATAITGVPTGSLWTFLLWWLAMSLTATAVVAVVYARLRRLLPLGALLELSLVFPDEAPSRFRLALGSGTVDSLEERLLLMKAANEATSAQQAAEILLRLAGALDVHDRITRGHSERVRAYSYSLGKELGLATDDLDRLNWAALLHDIGKLEVSTEILNKPGRPTEEEWAELREHPLHGETLVAPLRDWLGSWAEAVGHHHERWDGAGYPRGIAGDEIPFAGRIVAIADVYDVITSARSRFREHFSRQDAARDGASLVALARPDPRPPAPHPFDRRLFRRPCGPRDGDGDRSGRPARGSAGG
jgi:HD domain-containing protein